MQGLFYFTWMAPFYKHKYAFMNTYMHIHYKFQTILLFSKKTQSKNIVRC